MTLIIAIDGPAGSGKGTIARLLAQKYNLAYLDTGSLYRATAFLLTERKIDLDNEIHVKEFLSTCHTNELLPLLERKELRSEEISIGASKVGSYPFVRQILLDLQRQFAKSPPDHKMGAILDGRDIGTIILPDAPFKFFITASIEIRAKRRFEELKTKDPQLTYKNVLDDMLKRDLRDSQRKVAPLVKASDAIEIDSSDLTIEEVFEICVKSIESQHN